MSAVWWFTGTYYVYFIGKLKTVFNDVDLRIHKMKENSEFFIIGVRASAGGMDLSNVCSSVSLMIFRQLLSSSNISLRRINISPGICWRNIPRFQSLMPKTVQKSNAVGFIS